MPLSQKLGVFRFSKCGANNIQLTDANSGLLIQVKNAVGGWNTAHAAPNINLI
jgi:hypothetical protein